MKKAPIIITVLCCAVLGSAIYVHAGATANGFFLQGKTEQSSRSEMAAAYVNGEPIEEKTVENIIERKKVSASLQPRTSIKQFSSDNHSTVLEDLIQQKVLEQQAKKEGFAVTDQEALHALQTTDQQIQDIIKSGTDEEKKSAQEAWNAYTSFISGYGMSVEEYEKKLALPVKKAQMMRQKLYQNFIKEHSDTSRENLTKLWNDYVSGLIHQANIEREDNSQKSN
ncbi:MAG: SurA N-terminal domain-containing protein [Oscillospiraceae bacterium]|jgi:hypothetical protein|nr:SurA N-terminal domain-containing protein [Oscillospiraceae bacterium]